MPSNTTAELGSVEIVVPVEYRYTSAHKVIRDVRARYEADTSIGQLLAALVDFEARSNESAPPAGAQLAVGIRIRSSGISLELVLRLPDDAIVSWCNLRSGDQLIVGFASSMPNSLDVTDLGQIGSDELVLVDEVGPQRGRVTVVPTDRDIFIGHAPSGSPRVYIDDASVPATALKLRRKADSLARLESLSGDGVVKVSGETDAHEVYVGSRLSVGDRISFVATTMDAVLERNPLGKVRYDPIARGPLSLYPRSTDTLEPRPTPPDVDVRKLLEGFIAPAALGLVMFWFSRQPYFLAFIFVQPIVSTALFLRDKRKKLTAFVKEEADWTDRRVEQLARFRLQIAAETKTRNEEAAPLHLLLDALRNRDGSLWARQPEDRDFLVLKVGKGDLRSALRPDTTRLDEKDRQAVEPNLEADAVMQDVAVTIAMTEFNLALVGAREATTPVITNLLLQIFAQHSPSDVGVAALLPRAESLLADFDWLKWLPHFQSPVGVLPARPIAVGRKKCDRLLRFVRSNLEALGSDDRSRREYSIILVHEGCEVDRELLKSVVDASAGRVRVIWIGFGRDGVPARSADVILDVAPNGIVRVEDRVHAFREFKSFRATKQLADGSPIDGDLATSAAHWLAALFDPSATGKSAGLPTGLPLSALHRFSSVGELTRSTDEHLTSTVGVSDRGPLVVDLVKDGPHALVGGTTGSGKSELLQSLIVGFMVNHAPVDLVMILVDFKGGAAFDVFKHDPHVVGIVRDLDGDNIDRMLAFLRREIRRREEEFQEDLAAGYPTAKSYAEYRKTRGKNFAVPRLLLVVDEFATLVDVAPAFMKGIIDVAQRGRSLGVHMILATQQPSGDVIDGKVRANVGLRIALRTVDTGNSELIVDAPDAAYISRSTPGRAFLRAGSDPIVEFQAAFGGSKDFAARSKGNQAALVQVTDFILEEPDADDRADDRDNEMATSESEATDATEPTEPTDLEVLLSSIAGAPSPVCPVLGDRLGTVRELTRSHLVEAGIEEAEGALALVDDPHEQTQRSYIPSFESGALLICGGIGSGKSWALSAAAARFLDGGPARTAALVDCSGGGLAPAMVAFGLDRDRRVVQVDGGNLESVTRLIDQLHVLTGDPPSDRRGQLLVVIDGLAGLIDGLARGEGRRWMDRLGLAISLGRSRGVFVAVSTENYHDLPLEYRGGVRWVVRMGQRPNAEGERDVGLDAGLGTVDGRYLAQIVTDPVQPRSEEAPAIVQWLAGGPASLVTAPHPDFVGLRLGRDDIRNEGVEVLGEGRSLLVVGLARSGRTTVLRTIAEAATTKFKIVLLCGRPTRRATEWPTQIGSLSIDDLRTLGQDIADTVSGVEERVRGYLNGFASDGDERPPLFFIDDAHYLKKEQLVRAALEAIVLVGGCQVVLASDLNVAQYDGWRAIRESGDVLILRPAPPSTGQDEGELVAYTPLRQRPNASYQPCEGILISENRQTRMWI